jgi:hypothetical protein
MSDSFTIRYELHCQPKKMEIDGAYRCFLHWQIIGSIRSRVSSFEIVSQTKNRRIYPGLGTSLDVVVLRHAG